MYSVVIPIDGDEQRAERAVTAAAGLPAAETEYEFHVLNIFEERDATDDSGGPGLDAEELFERSKTPRSVHETELGLKERGLEVSVHRRLGKPAREILEFVDEIDANHIVMAGRSRTPVGKIVFGSVAQSVLLDANVPVTLVPKHSGK